MDTAGRSVVFAGATVVISLLGMLLMGIGFIGGLGITASLTVAVTVARVDHAAARAARLRRRQHRAHQVARPGRRRLRRLGLVGAGLEIPAARRRSASASRSLTIVLGFFVAAAASARCSTGRRSRAARPPPTGGAGSSSTGRGRSRIGAAALLLVLAIPVLSLRLGFSDESNFADDTTTKQAYDLIVEGFGKGSTGPIYLVAAVDGAEQVGALAAVNEAVAADPDVESVLGPAAQRPRRPDRGALARHARRAARRTRRRPQLVNRLRDDVLPPVEEATGADVLVTGARRRQRRHVALHGASGCRSSSAPCSRCRSCC